MLVARRIKHCRLCGAAAEYRVPADDNRERAVCIACGEIHYENPINAVVPVDQRCLDDAAALLRDQPLRLADALHLAAASRLPRPLTFVTFDPAQIPVALSLGFDVVSN